MKEMLQELKEFINANSVDEVIDELDFAFGFDKPEKVIYINELLEKIDKLEKKYLTN